MPTSRRFGRSRFTLILLVLASLTVLTLSYRDTGPVQSARKGVGVVFSPFEGVGNWVASPFKNAWRGVFEYDDIEDENARLRRQLDELRGNEAEARVAQQQIDELAALRRDAGLQVPGDIETVVAEVTEDGLTSFSPTFEINRGSGDGVNEGMVVVTAAGLLGRVESVTGGSARVRSITDPDYQGFGVKLVQGGDVGIARPGTDGTLVIGEGVSNETDVKAGDDVVTSGLDRSAYPPGLVVGTVTSRRPTTDRTEWEVTVEPAADLDGIAFVVVLLCADECS